MPTPASQPEEQRLPSPVPRYSVSWLSCPWPWPAGTSVSAPTEFWSRSSGLSCCHVGFGASAFAVVQTPPPETPTHRRHRFAVQFGSAIIAVTRLAVVSSEPANDVTPGWTPFVRGPKSFHSPLFHSSCRPRACLMARASARASFRYVALARFEIETGIVL